VADAIVQPWLEDLAAQTSHIGLGSADPFSVMDPLTVEPVGGVYHRSAVTLERVGLLLRNVTTDLVWPGLPPGTIITWYIGWDAPFNGNVTFSCPSPLLAFPSGGGWRVPAGDFFFGIGA
jgi:hypothetical protein